MRSLTEALQADNSDVLPAASIAASVIDAPSAMWLVRKARNRS